MSLAMTSNFPHLNESARFEIEKITSMYFSDTNRYIFP